MTEKTSPYAIKAHWERLVAVVLTLCAAAVRLGGLGDLGLSYDEAATALMARASAAEIITFHWTAGFEHPPLWQLLARLGSQLSGQSEYALRFLPALAGILVIPLLWQLTRWLYPRSSAVAYVSAAFAAISPILVYYSQDARMYTIVLALALGSMLTMVKLAKKPSWSGALLLSLINAVMTGFHYYAALLLVVEGLYFLIALMLWSETRRHWQKWLVALSLSALPLLLWMGFSPGFHMTLRSVMETAGAERTPIPTFLDELWRDLSFGAIRWQPDWAWIGYLLIPFLLLGLVDGLWQRRGDRWSRLSGWFLTLLLLVPILFSVILFGELSTRYLLYVFIAPVLLVSLGIVRLWIIARPLGLASVVSVLLVCVAALVFYRFDYAKSEYREMSNSLRVQVLADDGILLESPRQHLSAKYYLRAGNPFYPVPDIDLPTYWPVTAPSVVPEEVDGQIQDYLRKHPRLWLSLTAQDEVDLAEFLPKYLTAVSYQVGCRAFLDVDLCQYISPSHVTPKPVYDDIASFQGGLTLDGASVALRDENRVGLQQRFIDDLKLNDPKMLDGLRWFGDQHLLAELSWLADQQPVADYKVSLRLLDESGRALAQEDNFPIGPLLPPTTWQANDRKPGYMVLPIPAIFWPGRYQLALTLYDPSTMETIPYTIDNSAPSTAPLVLANIEVGDTIEVVPVTDDAQR